MNEQEIKDKLYEICKSFIDRQQISCNESIYQSDRVIENAYTFIDDICELVGYYKYPDSDE